ncbi:expressed unknown protein [Seminavis robusta]|uniref:Uncharacterized protein n=1 Tax=Seminavis robusta TaxID=568900 RepID=A0A9N8H5E2_9STRA|nr:expressed unknown protein [Seminavis robusta]|eukprot:Sro72_g039880.1 n/a (89) ;mRNA; f:66726-66992
MAVDGTGGHAPRLLKMAIWNVSNMPMKMAFHGMKTHAALLLAMAIWSASNMPMKMAVPGINTTCRFAADNGHLECLKYAHEKVVPGLI